MTASYPVFKPVTLPGFQNGNETSPLALQCNQLKPGITPFYEPDFVEVPRRLVFLWPTPYVSNPVQMIQQNSDTLVHKRLCHSFACFGLPPRQYTVLLLDYCHRTAQRPMIEANSHPM